MIPPVLLIDLPGHGRLGGYNFHAGCPYIRPSVTKTQTRYNANVGARKTIYALRRTSCMKIMTTYWLGPGGSLLSLPNCSFCFLITLV